ncbi:MAG TPA: SH3 domain-containing protein [Phototrophicaceae bacterium]|nr:SH3 domain-containing protein [Phototrophicaceae bacterium]
MLRKLALVLALALTGFAVLPGAAQATCPAATQTPVTVADQSVPVILVGNATLARIKVVLLPVAPAGHASVNVRTQPSSSGAIVTTIPVSGSLNADGRLEDSSWLRVELTNGGIGWVAASVSKVTGDVSTLAVLAASDTTPKTGYTLMVSPDSNCADAPSGVLIQTADTLALSINGVSLTLNKATAFVSIANQALTVAVLDGTATVGAQGQTVSVFAGTETTVALDANGLASDKPSALTGYDATTVAQLPVTQLAVAVTAEAPLTADEITAKQSQFTEGTYRFVATGYACPSGGISAAEVQQEGKTLIQNVPPWTTTVSNANNNVVMTVVDYGRTNHVTLASGAPGHFEDMHTAPNGSRVGYKLDVTAPTTLRLTLILTYKVTTTAGGVTTGGEACNDFELYVNGTLQG